MVIKVTHRREKTWLSVRQTRIDVEHRHSAHRRARHEKRQPVSFPFPLSFTLFVSFCISFSVYRDIPSGACRIQAISCLIFFWVLVMKSCILISVLILGPLLTFAFTPCLLHCCSVLLAPLYAFPINTIDPQPRFVRAKESRILAQNNSH